MSFRRIIPISICILFTLSLIGCGTGKVTVDSFKRDAGPQTIAVKFHGDFCIDFVPEVYVDKDNNVWQYCETWIKADMKKYHFSWKSGPKQEVYSKLFDNRPDFLSQYHKVSMTKCGANKYCGEYSDAGYKFTLWQEGRYDSYLEYTIKSTDQQAAAEKPLVTAEKPQPAAVKPQAPDKGFVINQGDAKVYYNPPKTLFATPLTTQANAPAANIYFGLVTIKPGAVVPMHDHGATYEILYVQSGSATVTIGEMLYKIKPGSVAYLPANVKHGLLNDSEKDLVGFQIYGPPGNPTADAKYFNWPTVGK